MRARILILSVISFLSMSLAAQIPVGQWRVHSSFHSITSVVDAGDRLYALGDNNLFSVTFDDSYMETINKVDGLSESSISKIAYDKGNSCLVIVYTNANIDVIDASGEIHNIRDLYVKEMSADKSVYDIMFIGQTAYLATGFGIVALNLDKYEVKDTYIIGTEGGIAPVYSLTKDDTYIYALMGESVKRAPITGKNLLDYNSWESGFITLPDNATKYVGIELFAGSFVVVADRGDIYRSVDGSWSVIYENSTKNYVWLHRCDNNLVVGGSGPDGIIRFDASWNRIAIYGFPAVGDALIHEGIYWIAAYTEGLVKHSPGVKTDILRPNGPYLKYSQKLTFDGERILVAPGHSWLNRGMREGAILMYSNNSWSSYNSRNTDATLITPDNYFYDVVSVAVDPSNPKHIFATTWGEGVYEFLDDNVVALYNNENTNGVLKYISNYGPHYVRADGLTFDKEGNLWVLLSLEAAAGTYNNVCYMTPDKVWHEATGFSPLETCATLQQLLLHPNGQKWIRSARSTPGIFVKYENKSRFFTTFTDKDGNILTPSFIYDMAIDRNGDVWVGTSEGPIVFNTPNKVFELSYRCTRIKIPRNDGTGLADYLLGEVEVTAIAIDGGDRKWIGTSKSGVYVVSSDGQITYNHFTAENSMLPSNDISSIAIDSKSGSVFIGTSDGLVEYRDGTTEPVKKFDESKIKVFPNPVRPDYTGMITVEGLEENCVVKITDASGNLVYDGNSVGGSLSWDGKNYHGTYVSSGVYYFHLFNTDENNSRSNAAKVLIIR